MATKIYFDTLNAEAMLPSDIQRGGTASVVDMWDGHAYIGRHQRVKFSTVQPAKWHGYRDIRTLHHIKDGGFAFDVASE